MEAGGPHLAVCSHRGQVVLGYNEVEISMKGSGYMFIHAADMMHCAENHTRMIKTGETGITIFRLLSKSGRWIWVQSNARMVLKAGKPDFIVARQRALTNEEGEEQLRLRRLQLPFSLTTGEGVLYDTLPSLQPDPPRGQNQNQIQNPLLGPDQNQNQLLGLDQNPLLGQDQNQNQLLGLDLLLSPGQDQNPLLGQNQNPLLDPNPLLDQNPLLGPDQNQNPLLGPDQISQNSLLGCLLSQDQSLYSQDAAALSSLSDAAFQDSHATLSIPGDAAGNGGPARADAALQEVMSTLQDILEDGELMGALEVAPEELKGWESALLRLSGEAGADPGDVLSYFEEQLQLDVPVEAWPAPAPPAPNGAPVMAPPLSHLDFPPVAVAPQPNAVIPLAPPRRPQNQLAAAFLMPDHNGPPHAAPPPHVAAATLQGRRPNPAFSQWNGAGQNISNGFHADAAAPGLFTPALHEPPWPQRRPHTADDVIGRAPLRAPHAATPPSCFYQAAPAGGANGGEAALSCQMAAGLAPNGRTGAPQALGFRKQMQISSLGGAGFPFPLLPNGSCFSDSK
ncbi:unnamed protein product [Menidia menidia]|uniref:(Atlantic silverside) hypothetical protein n=1 Tax=Menidia menidia TaxID=238744 RepID=A0A8S4BJ09_9TELE|nr:unnamed protein product [Menidia menidia]